MKISKIFIILVLLVSFNKVFAGELIINSNQSDPAPKKAWAEIIKIFKNENPDIKVKVNSYSHEGYKESIRNWLVTSPPDIVYWFAGNRMKFFVTRHLFDDISDVWKKEKLYHNFSSTLSAVSVNGKQYGLPVSFYQWGIYYNKAVFKKYKLSIPKNFKQLLKISAILKSNNITPFTIGTRFLWPAAGWFDYLDLRINGYDFHIALMEGKIPYTDARVRKVFNTWKRIVEPGYYIKNHASYDWIAALSPLVNKKAGMYLMGNFLTANLSKNHQIGFFPFPSINKNVKLAEDAPVDTIHIPTKAKNKAEARRFLAFVATARIQSMLNKQISLLPPHKKAKVLNDEFIKAGKKLLSKASTAQFYDRDTNASMAKEGMKGFQEFLEHPDRLEKILKRLEKVRRRVFKK